LADSCRKWKKNWLIGKPARREKRSDEVAKKKKRKTKKKLGNVHQETEMVVKIGKKKFQKGRKNG